MSPLLLVALAAPSLAQSGPSYPLEPIQVFANLSYGPNAWSLLSLNNPSTFIKSARVDIYRSDGKPIRSGRVVTLAPNQSLDIRIEKQARAVELCWARVEDTSKSKSGQPLQASARVERVVGNKLEDFPQYVIPPQAADQWVSPANAVSEKELFFLNTADTPTLLEVCSIDRWATCWAEGVKPVRTPVKPRQAIVLRIGNIRKRALLIRSIPRVVSVIGLLGPELPMIREYSSQSFITFDEPAQE